VDGFDTALIEAPQAHTKVRAKADIRTILQDDPERSPVGSLEDPPFLVFRYPKHPQPKFYVLESKRKDFQVAASTKSHLTSFRTFLEISVELVQIGNAYRQSVRERLECPSWGERPVQAFPRRSAVPLLAVLKLVFSFGTRVGLVSGSSWSSSTCNPSAGIGPGCKAW